MAAEGSQDMSIVTSSCSSRLPHNRLCPGWAVGPFALQPPGDTRGTGVEGVKIRKAIKATGDSSKLLLVGQNTNVKIHINFLPRSRSFADIDNSLRMKLTAAALICTIEL